jgi:lysozyme family protein
MDINKAFDIVMEFEGGDAIVSIPYDKGGVTKYGISKNSFPEINITNLTKDQAKAIYFKNYWEIGGCIKLQTELQYIYFDTAVNMGVSMAVKILQEACNVTIDGILGPVTIEESRNVDPVEYLLLRAIKYSEIIKNDPSQLIFQKGWNNRILAILKLYKLGQLT